MGLMPYNKRMQRTQQSCATDAGRLTNKKQQSSKTTLKYIFFGYTMDIR